MKRLLPFALLALLSAGVIAACKQSEGGRCQVNSDCEGDLRCNQGTNPPSCQSSDNGDQIDATVPEQFPDGPVDASDAADASDAPDGPI